MNIDTLKKADGTFRLCSQGVARRALATNHVTHLQRDDRTVAMRKSEIDGVFFFTLDFSNRTEYQTRILSKAADKVVFFLNQGLHDWQANDALSVFVNQAEREATVLAVIGAMVLVEYEMPAGTTAMLLFDATYYELRGRRNVAYSTCPLRWIKAMQDADMEWLGMGQRRPANQPLPMPAKQS